MLQKIKRGLILGSFVLVVLTTTVSFGNGNRVYAGSTSSTTVSCGALWTAVFNKSPRINGRQLTQYSGSLSGNPPRLTTLTKNLAPGMSSGALPSCTNTNKANLITIPSGTQSLEYSLSSKGSEHEIAIVYAITNSSSSSGPYSPTQACGGNLSCVSCLSRDINPSGSINYVYTDFGCIDATTSGVINFMYAFLLAIAVMIDLVIFIISGYLIMTSNGDPDKINRGKTLFKNAIIGLIVIIFAVVLLQLIGSIFGVSQL